MKSIINKMVRSRKHILLLLFILLLIKCEEADKPPIKDIELQISTYLEEHENQFSEFLSL